MTGEVSCATMDSSVGSELVGLVEQGGLELVLVRGWDSQRRPEFITAALSRLGIPSTCLPGGALVELKSVDVEALASVLFGFDELWIGSSATNWSALNSMPPMTSDCVDLSRDDCAPFKKGLLEAGAKLALGDGLGLNIVRVLADE